jgi:hypothetical protein
MFIIRLFFEVSFKKGRYHTAKKLDIVCELYDISKISSPLDVVNVSNLTIPIIFIYDFLMSRAEKKCLDKPTTL